MKSVLYNDNKILAKYVKNLRQHKILNEEEQRALLVKAQSGDEKARDTLIITNMRFVMEIAKKYKSVGVSTLELISEGSLGVFEAIDKFDSTRQNNFISYAVWWIKYYMVRLLQRDSNMIRIPVNKMRKISQIHQMEDELYQKEPQDRKNKDYIIAKNLCISEMYVADLKKMIQKVESLDQEVNGVNEGMVSRGDILEDTNIESPDEFVLHREKREAMYYCLDKIPAREADIIKKRFGIDGKKSMSLKELSQEYGLTKERIRQLEIRGIKQIRVIAKNIGMYEVA